MMVRDQDDLEQEIAERSLPCLGADPRKLLHQRKKDGETDRQGGRVQTDRVQTDRGQGDLEI